MSEGDVIHSSIAIASLRLKEGELVHTFLVSPVALIGADMELSDVKAEAEKWGGFREAGPQARKFQHGIVIQRPEAEGSSLFLETLPVVE